MSDPSAPRITHWPFFLGDLLLIGLAAFTLYMSTPPFQTGPVLISAVCVIIGAWLSILPFLRNHQTAVRLAEAQNLTSTVEQVRNLEEVGRQITQAVDQLHHAKEHSDQTVTAAREIADHMSSEAKSFGEFLQKAQDSEKSHLRLEIDKLRRAEGEWLEVMVHVLDHVYALYLAAARSAQPGLIDQLTHFQNACRDVVRRVGLVPYSAIPNEPFDPKRHQLRDGQEPPEAGSAFVAETVATGYTYQGQLLRKAMVCLQPLSVSAPDGQGEAPATNPAASSHSDSHSKESEDQPDPARQPGVSTSMNRSDSQDS